jgi:hypothetical protein
MRDFNYQLSRQRITVEHAFGALKGRFRSLQRLGAHRNEEDNWRVIESLLILHNMCLYYGDRPEQFDGLQESQKDKSDTMHLDIGNPDDTSVNMGETTHLPEHESDVWLKEEGHKMRNQMLDELFSAEDYMYI